MTKLWPVQALACVGGGGDGGGATKNIVPPKLSNFGDIVSPRQSSQSYPCKQNRVINP